MRLASIDVLRSVAIVVMVVVHFLENLAGTTTFVAGTAAPMFSFLSGLSYHSWVSREATRVSPSLLTLRSIRRALFLFGIGFAFNILVWLPQDTFNWDVLTLIGVGMSCLTFLRHAPSAAIAAIIVGCLLLAPIARQELDYAAYWTATHFDPDMTLSDVTAGLVATGYFPILPWLAFPLTGYLVGRLLRPSAAPQSQAPRLIGIAVAAVFVTAMLQLACAVLPAREAKWSMFPATTRYALGSLAGSVSIFLIAHILLDGPRSGHAHRVIRVLAEPLSGHSLTIYVLHHAVHLWPLWIYGALTGPEPTWLWRQATTPTLALMMSVAFLLAVIALLALGTRRLPTLERLMRWLCD